jgi:hypothetical protein
MNEGGMALSISRSPMRVLFFLGGDDDIYDLFVPKEVGDLRKAFASAWEYGLLLREGENCLCSLIWEKDNAASIIQILNTNTFFMDLAFLHLWAIRKARKEPINPRL